MSTHHHTTAPMTFVTVTDENGVDFHALTNGVEDAHGRISAWVFTDKTSGFGDDVGNLNYKTGLQKLPDGKYGA